MTELRVVRVVSCGLNHMRGGLVPEWETADVQMNLRRRLPNPFKVPELRDLGGLDQAVQEFVQRQQPAWPVIRASLLDAVQQRLAAGHAVVTVAVMCSGGHDRSVAVAELLAGEIRGWDAVDAFTRHLHLYRRHPWVPDSQRVNE